MKKYLWNFFGKLEIYPYMKKKFWGKKVSDPYISENVKKHIEENPEIRKKIIEIINLLVL